MSKELTTKSTQTDLLASLRDTVAPGLTNAEFLLFSEIVKATGLNPVTKEIWAIKAGGRLQIMTGINGFLKIANSHPQFDGMELSYEWDGKALLSATAKVYRKDRRFPSVATAYIAEYAKQTPIWKQMPSIMLGKCAKSLAIREAFINELGGLYTQEEMPNGYGSDAVTVVPARIVSPVETVNESTGEVVVEEDNAPFLESEIAAKPKSRKARTTWYDISKIEDVRLKEGATKYLTECACVEVDGKWKCPIKLEKLTQFIVEVE